MRNQRGVTLIALVITIIVLLILAGVSIAMLTGDNGILTQANQAKYQSAQGEAKEKINLALNAVKTEVYSQRVSKANWDPVTEGFGTDKTITKILKDDGFGDASTTAGAEVKYYYNLTGSTLTIGYQSKAEANLDAPITGVINLDTTADGSSGNEPNSFLEIVEAK